MYGERMPVFKMIYYIAVVIGCGIGALFIRFFDMDF